MFRIQTRQPGQVAVAAVAVGHNTSYAAHSRYCVNMLPSDNDPRPDVRAPVAVALHGPS